MKKGEILNRLMFFANAIAKKSNDIEQGITFYDLNALWMKSSLNPNSDEPMSKRAFWNDLEAIQELFGINIECPKETNKYRFDGDPFGTAAQRWLLNNFTLTNALKESRKIKDRIIIDDVPSAQEWLAPILDAIQMEVKVDFTYLSFKSKTGAKTEKDVSPLLLKLYGGRWYLYWRREAGDDLHICSLDRMKSLTITEEKTNLKPSDEDYDHLSKLLGYSMKKEFPYKRLVIRAYCDEPQFLRTLPLHQSQYELEVTPDYTDFAYCDVISNTDFLLKLLSLGSLVEVIEPKGLRSAMKIMIQRMANVYAEPSKK